ncbi:hypothetical protein H4S00_001973 [Coemansia sp. D1744]|nr:hypothetical protein H4S00_001973 [Coemansia sp. D1744]
MSKRKDTRLDNDDRVDFIHVGTEFPSAQEQLRRRQKEQRGFGDDKPKGYSRNAFNGGYSAGYFGTVGSKEGWKSTTEFVSSRSNRVQQRKMEPEDFMDAEDIADLRASRTVTVNRGFYSNVEDDVQEQLINNPNVHDGIVASMAEIISAEFSAIHIRSDRVGDQVMTAMGWKPGQGIGPLSRSVCHPDNKTTIRSLQLPPLPSLMATVETKSDHHGADYGVDLASLPTDRDCGLEESALLKIGTIFARKSADSTAKTKKKQAKKIDKLRLSFGAFDDADDDDGDYYIGKKNTHAKLQPKETRPAQLQQQASNTQTKAAPACQVPSFVNVTCHDGRPPLLGFVLRESIQPPADSYVKITVPSIFTGTHATVRSRWDTAPAAEARAKLGKPQTVPETLLAEETAELSQVTYSTPKPNTAMLARFVAANSTPDDELISKPDFERAIAPKTILRNTCEWVPSRILCKRLNIPPPAQAIAQSETQQTKPEENHHGRWMRAADFMNWSTLDASTMPMILADSTSKLQDAEPQPRPEMALFQSIFGCEE